MKPLHPLFCDALPVGNGSLGAVVYGGVPEECMSLNLDTLWSGTGRRMEQKIAKHVLEDVKKQCAQEHYFEAQNLIERKMLGQYNESYMPLGSFRYHYYGIENVENYRRELDLEEAVVRTEFTCAGRQYQSEVFVSNPASCDGSASGIRNKKMKIDFWLESKLQTISTIQRENSQMISGNAPSHVDPNYVESENQLCTCIRNWECRFAVKCMWTQWTEMFLVWTGKYKFAMPEKYEF